MELYLLFDEEKKFISAFYDSFRLEDYLEKENINDDYKVSIVKIFGDDVTSKFFRSKSTAPWEHE